MTSAALFPELRGSRRWWHLGRRLLGCALADQIAADGSIIDTSVLRQALDEISSFFGLGPNA